MQHRVADADFARVRTSAPAARRRFCRRSISLPYDSANDESPHADRSHVAPAWRQAIAERGARWPHLARLGGRGSIRALPPPRDGLRIVAGRAARCARHSTTTREYPSAAVTRTGDAQERARGFWLHLQPMHFMAGLDRLTAVMLHGASRRHARGAGGAGADRSAHICVTAAMQLVTTSQDGWLVHSRARARRADRDARDCGGESARAGDAGGSRRAGAAPAA